MDYTCSVCGDKIEGDLVVLKDHTEDHIIDLVKKEHPDWIQEDGMCTKCVEYFRNELKGNNQ